MDEYLVPTQFGEAEFIEKKSRFIGRLWPVETEEEALIKIQQMKKQHYDCLLYTSPSPRDQSLSRMPSSA